MQRAPGADDDIFGGPGEMTARCREFDWASTSLGPVERWSPALRTIVRTVMDSPFAINLWCGPAKVLIYNDAYRRVLGAKHPSALGRPGRDVWSEVWGDVGPMFEQIDRGGPPLFAENQRFAMARTGVEGELAHAWFTFGLSAVRDESGAIVAYFNPAAETTGQVMAEQAAIAAGAVAAREESRLREVFAQAPAFIAVLRGAEHTFEFANEAYYRLIGRRDIVGRSVLDALPEVADQQFVGLLDEVLATGEPFIGREVPVALAPEPGAAPQTRYVDFVYMAFVEADGTRSGVVAHGVDVTAQVLARREVERLLEQSRRAQAEAEAARREAEHANRAKSQFLATMSHELRTPLNAIGGYAELMEMGIQGSVTDAQLEFLARIRRSQRHLLGLINEVLNYARVEAGAVRYERVPVRLGEVLAACEALIAPQAGTRGLTLDFAGCDAGLVAVADRDKVQQVVLNLLSNAVKFTDQGGTVRLSCAGAGGRVQVRVSDTGIGIPSDKLHAVFEPFVQVNAGLTRSQEGTGLGLAISRDLARGMGGDLTAESTLGVGSTFTLSLPTA